ncbi:uncharacterized protein LOC121694417 [Alosa sapidissima]|uniref:uncharacterized protein LOC121694417 n=1 Tax=Alosa sapidissima TaxID=34773 RepID=UPI001C084F1F|nr:uncharacterized protein LOC121694417 [Alosa sapidissima]
MRDQVPPPLARHSGRSLLLQHCHQYVRLMEICHVNHWRGRAPEALEQSLHNINVQSKPHMMDESEFNDLRNSVIDWGTDEEDNENHDKDDNSHDEDDNSQNEYYVPHISIRIGGALPTSCIDSLPIIGMSDVVHDIDAEIEPPSAHIPMPPTILPAQLEVLAEDDLIGKRASICYEDCLKQLAAVLMLPIKGEFWCDIDLKCIET